MDYISVKQAALSWGISERVVQRYCTNGRIPNAAKFGGAWLIPADAKKPDDPRRKADVETAKEVMVQRTRHPSDKKNPVNRYQSDENTRNRTQGNKNLMNEPQEAERVTRSQMDFESAARPSMDSGSMARPQSNHVGMAGSVSVKPSDHIAMPLINTSFRPGYSGEAIVRMEDADERNLALAEYYFFTGQAQKASDMAAPYLNHEDLALKLSACWLVGYANMTLDQIPAARYALHTLHTAAAKVDEHASDREKALATCMPTGANVMLHLPIPKDEKPRKKYIALLQPGLRLFLLYVEAHYAYLGGHYGMAVGIAETALSLENEPYPIPTIYLHLAAAMGYMGARKPELARGHVLEAWEIAQPDHLIEPFAEHHGLLGGLLEATLKKSHPEEFKQIIQITYRFSAGWRKIHNPVTGENVADNLSTTEFAVAMLAARGWTNREIADHMGISEHTVRHHISVVLQKLHISQRKELQRFMLK